MDRARSSLVASFARGVTKMTRRFGRRSHCLPNGQSRARLEGQIVRLKLVRRQMYGRGKIDLLQPD
jgi:transposase